MENAEETLKHFDSIFDADTLKTINFSNMKMLKALYEYFEEDIYTPSPQYSKLRHNHIKISDKLEETFSEMSRRNYLSSIGN